MLAYQILQDFWAIDVEGCQRREEVSSKLQINKKKIKIFTVYEKEYQVHHSLIHQHASESLSTWRVSKTSDGSLLLDPFLPL